MLGDSTEAIQDDPNSIDRYFKVVRLRIDSSKTKMMSTKPHPWVQLVTLGGVPPEEFESFK